MKAFACYNLDETIRKNSSSGGIFYLLSEYVIMRGGVVFGAEFDENFAVRHGCAETLDAVGKFMGSKYVQSSIGDSYLRVKAFLEEGRLVLFSGTPCQVASLVSFLGGKPDHLIAVDLICHGVSSPEVWNVYLKEVKNGRAVKSVNFRNKTDGWENYSLEIQFQDGSVYRKSLNEDLYMQSFLQNLTLRPSCYACQFKGTDRVADFTLGDLWGVKVFLPEMYDDKGTSFVLVHSELGEEVWKYIALNMRVKEIALELAGEYNLCLNTSVACNKKRTKFFANTDFSIKRLKRMTSVSIPRKIARKLKRSIKRMLRLGR